MYVCFAGKLGILTLVYKGRFLSPRNIFVGLLVQHVRTMFSISARFCYNMLQGLDIKTEEWPSR
jgi:hypothetical protein